MAVINSINESSITDRIGNIVGNSGFYKGFCITLVARDYDNQTKSYNTSYRIETYADESLGTGLNWVFYETLRQCKKSINEVLKK